MLGAGSVEDLGTTPRQTGIIALFFSPYNLHRYQSQFEINFDECVFEELKASHNLGPFEKRTIPNQFHNERETE